jgi:hypothetical protein
MPFNDFYMLDIRSEFEAKRSLFWIIMHYNQLHSFFLSNFDVKNFA